MKVRYFKPTHKENAHLSIKYVIARRRKISAMTISNYIDDDLTRSWTMTELINAARKGYWIEIEESEVALL